MLTDKKGQYTNQEILLINVKWCQTLCIRCLSLPLYFCVSLYFIPFPSIWSQSHWVCCLPAAREPENTAVKCDWHCDKPCVCVSARLSCMRTKTEDWMWGRRKSRIKKRTTERKMKTQRMTDRERITSPLSQSEQIKMPSIPGWTMEVHVDQ